MSDAPPPASPLLSVDGLHASFGRGETIMRTLIGRRDRNVYPVARLLGARWEPRQNEAGDDVADLKRPISLPMFVK